MPLLSENNIIWKDINNFESRYQISNFGEVRNKNTGFLLKKRIRGSFYIVALFKKQKYSLTPRVDKLVAEHFLVNDNPINKTHLEHLDSDLLNNSCYNLKWAELKTNDNEIWKDIINYNGQYQISNYGEVRSLLRNKILKKLIHDSYYYVFLVGKNKIKKEYKIHILVAKHFIENEDPKNKQIVDHIDNNKLNNNFINLRWVTASENVKAWHDNFKIKKKIIQFDENYQFVKLWNSIEEILLQNKFYKKHNIICGQNNKKLQYNYYWEYLIVKDKFPIIEKWDEIFKNIGKIGKYDFSDYKISNYGNIKNIKNNIFLCSKLGTKKYYQIRLKDIKSNKHINVSIHRLVAQKFVKGRTEFKKFVNHLDKNKQNNFYKNLEWSTPKENSEHSHGKKIKQIDLDTNQIIKIFNTIADANKFFGKNVKNTNINYCCKAKTKHAYGYKWEFIH
ncbi:HNH endonuclease [uncultured virus]|nr:HNH endonuclease [uncultured virus]